MDPDRPIFRITLRAQAQAWGPPPVIRLRRALKTLLRAFGLRCLVVEELPAPKDQAA